MKPLLYASLAAYVVAAVHSILAFVNKRRGADRVTTVSLIIGFAAHTAAIITDWIQTGHYPLFSLPETATFLSWTLVIAYGLAVYRYRIRALGVFLLPIVCILVFASSVMRDGNALINASRVTGCSAAWLFPIHTTLLFLAYAAFFVAFAASVMYLWQESALKSKNFNPIFHRLPSLTTVDDIGSTTAGVGFTLFSLGIITGVMWSSACKGRMWHNDPIELFALLTWVIYLALLHFRVQWRGRKAAWLGIAGFCVVLCTFAGALLLGGYHVFG